MNNNNRISKTEQVVDDILGREAYYIERVNDAGVHRISVNRESRGEDIEAKLRDGPVTVRGAGKNDRGGYSITVKA